MSSLSFLNFQNGLSRKVSLKPTQSSLSKQRQSPSFSKVFQPNVEEMKGVFNKFDINKDGKISREEYKLALRALGRGNEGSEVSKVFEAIDTDGDGFIDFKEFMEVHNRGGGVKTSDIQRAFRVFDLDGNGKISAEELLEVMRKLGERCSLEACRKMVRGVDTDGDGLIDMDEFMSMMTNTMKLS
ncbi:calmodulin-like protein 30 [Cornus florida]|uniref:calmodulin-like protein 30 n=1 Tax=Cornus florida TaxID=4283 RepID=UPI0028985A0B|nr:calmodulin-like protein 30 [Cornus florida]